MGADELQLPGSPGLIGGQVWIPWMLPKAVSLVGW